MSLLGPDDLNLGKKERKKKLAKDLSPEVYKQIEKWLDREDDPEALQRISELVGPDEARKLVAKKKMNARKDSLLDER